MDNKIELYEPSTKEVELYLRLWNYMENYVNQEHALNKLFFRLCKRKDNLEDVLIKCSTLNDFYSTNIFNIHAVAKHILELIIDNQLDEGDPTVVEDIAHVRVGEIKEERFFYSFATRYCSHHQSMKFAIYDNYVDKVLRHLNKRDKFISLAANDLKCYPLYLQAIKAFQKKYGLEQYNLKQMDQYLWQLGKHFFNPYSASNDTEKNKIALKYTIEHGYDSIRPAGERNGYKYFNYYNVSNLGRKTGMPKFVKIDNNGNCIDI